MISARVIVVALSGLAAPNPVMAQVLTEGRDSGVSWLRVTAALILCLMLAAAAILIIRRRMGMASGMAWPALSRWHVLFGLSGRSGESTLRLANFETHRITPHLTVTVFTCDGKSFLISASSQGGLEMVPLDASAKEPKS